MSPASWRACTEAQGGEPRDALPPRHSYTEGGHKCVHTAPTTEARENDPERRGRTTQGRRCNLSGFEGQGQGGILTCTDASAQHSPFRCGDGPQSCSSCIIGDVLRPRRPGLGGAAGGRRTDGAGACGGFPVCCGQELCAGCVQYCTGGVVVVHRSERCV